MIEEVEVVLRAVVFMLPSRRPIVVEVVVLGGDVFEYLEGDRLYVPKKENRDQKKHPKAENKKSQLKKGKAES